MIERRKDGEKIYAKDEAARHAAQEEKSEKEVAKIPLSYNSSHIII